MISQLPGWLNFIVLSIVYFIPLSVFFKIVGIENSITMILLRISIVEFFAGAYLSKWREKPGGGLSFNGMTKAGWIIGGILFAGMIIYLIF